ncbi:MFS transporter, partial [Candidatus Kaiserbacteria bacterium]|nr:MFS transporter [Candidatus Kaiserbacteria bacterium]
AVSLALGFFVLGIFPALTNGVQRALASELSPEERRAGAFGFVNAVSGFGLLFAGIIGGWVWGNFGSEYAFLGAGISVLLGVGILLGVSRAPHSVP